MEMTSNKGCRYNVIAKYTLTCAYSSHLLQKTPYPCIPGTGKTNQSYRCSVLPLHKPTFTIKQVLSGSSSIVVLC